MNKLSIVKIPINTILGIVTEVLYALFIIVVALLICIVLYLKI